MPSKMASMGVIGAGAYGASLAFTSAYSPPASGGALAQQRQQPQLRSAPTAASAGAPLSSTACAVSGVMLLAGVAAHSGARSAKRSVRMAATGDDEEPAFAVGQRVLVLAPPAMAGKQGNVQGQVGDSFAIRFDSGSVFNILTENLLDAYAPAPAVARAAPAAASAAMHVQGHAEGSYEHGEFEPGQRVLVLGPPAMAGKQGTIVGLAAYGADTYAVRFDTGSVFNFTEANLTDNLQRDVSGSNVRFKVDPQGASHMYHNINAPVTGNEPCPPDACDLDELEFQPGERVAVLGPPAMAGKQGTVVGPALGEAFAIRFDSGSVFNILTDFLQSLDPARAVPAAAAPVAAAPAAAKKKKTGDEDELEFQPGQRVLVLAPPAMAGKQATVVGPALGDVFACRFDSGSVFNFPAENLEDAASPAPAASAPAPPADASSHATKSGGDDELEFQPGQNVTITGPPAMAGKRGVIVGPALNDAFAVRFDTGSVFNIATGYIRA
eukprot:TRINITY_DN9275_c0_g2_i1.p1 TRINITY_DN9275_c0_g2~~TRINITY_DN9275_c0_g2_i1.p1  ORF type:complete len:516 (+),score=115.34 TRINITY_DN9275_c0_g2_i1:61-1548(+)